MSAAPALVVASGVHGADTLRPHAADISKITVSGISSGGYMAVQLHVAHSATVKGAGVFAAGPYYCAGGYSTTAYYNCTTPTALAPLPAVAKLHDATEALARQGRIDDTSHLRDAKVWIFTGTHDRTVSQDVVKSLREYYVRYVEPARVAFISDRPAGHAIVSADPDVHTVCEATQPPFINRCADRQTGKAYDGAGALFAHLFGEAVTAANVESGDIVAFDQRPYVTGSPYSLSLADVGYVYVPARCRTERCRVHVAFHGCRQNADAVQTAFVRDAGYNRWADAYRLIVLYPQTISRNGWGRDFTFVLNPRACWDWWGYTGGEYHTKDGAQIRAVMNMVRRLGEPR